MTEAHDGRVDAGMNPHASPTHLGDVVPFRRGEPGVAHSDEIRARCFVLYATAAARNCADVERLLSEELADTGDPVPTCQAIANWARDDRWADQADDL
jgi:hypothetical protein